MAEKITAFLSRSGTITEQTPEPCHVRITDGKKQGHQVSASATPIPRTKRFILSFLENTTLPAGVGTETVTQTMSDVLYSIPEPTFAIDRSGKITAWNRALEELTGISAGDMLGKGNREYAIPFFRERRLMIIDLIFATDPEIEKMGYRDIQWTGNTLTADITGLPADGKSRHIREIASPVFSESGELDGAIESITDISMTEHRERVLGDTASKCMIILENIATAIAIIEEDAIISYVNPEFEKIIGYVREEVEGKKKWTEFVAPKELERMRKFEYESRINPENATPNHEFRFIRFDGQLRHGSLTMTPVPEPGKLILSLVDISGKVQEGDALQKANRKLNSFSCITRHEILNHLTVVKGYIESSRDQVRDPAFLLRSFDKQLAAANAIQNLITFTRDYQNIGIQPPAWYAITGLIQTVSSGMNMGSVAFTVSTDRVEIYADHLLEKVFFHLIDNALRYGRKIKNLRFHAQESFEELVIICEDDGIGIPPDAKEKIFKRQFFQNTGLDMYLSRQILSITGISIRETGIYGTGARFEIRVPKGAYRFINSPKK